MSTNSNQNDKQPQQSTRVLPKVSQYLIGFGLIGLSTIGFYNQCLIWRSKSTLKQFLQKAIVLDQSMKKTSTQMIYSSGKINTNSKQPFSDSLFGLTSTNKDSLGLYRKVEVFHPTLKSQIVSWNNINQADPKYIDEIYHNLKSKVILNDVLKLNSYTLSKSLAIEFAEKNALSVPINENKINTHFDSLKDKFDKLAAGKQTEKKETDKKEKSDSRNFDSLQAQGMYNLHPFKLSQEKKKNIYFEDNFIYICQDRNSFTEGDIRISFYDIEKLSEATVLAFIKDGQIDALRIPELNYDVKIYDKNGEFTVVRLGLVNFIEKGILPQTELIENIINRLGNNTELKIGLYALSICVIYIILDRIKDSVDVSGDKDNLSKRIFQNKYLFLLSPINHLASVVLFFNGYVLGTSLFGSSLIIYQMLVFQKFFKSDTQYFQQLKQEKDSKNK